MAATPNGVVCVGSFTALPDQAGTTTGVSSTTTLANYPLWTVAASGISGSTAGEFVQSIPRSPPTTVDIYLYNSTLGVSGAPINRMVTTIVGNNSIINTESSIFTGTFDDVKKTMNFKNPAGTVVAVWRPLYNTISQAGACVETTVCPACPFFSTASLIIVIILGVLFLIVIIIAIAASASASKCKKAAEVRYPKTRSAFEGYQGYYPR